MMQRKAFTLAAAIALCAGSASWSQEPAKDPLRRLFPEEAYRITVKNDLNRDGVRRYEGVSLRGDVRDIGIGAVTFSTYPDGDFAVAIDNLTLHPHEAGAAVVSLSGVKLKLDDFPDYRGDGVCALQKVIEHADLAALEAQFPAADAEARPDVFRLEGFAFERRGAAKSDCWIDGVMGLDKGRLSWSSGWGVGLEDLRLQGRVPLSVSAARGKGARSSKIIGSIAELELSNASEIPAFGMSQVAFKSNLDAAGLAGWVHVVRSSTILSAKPNRMLEMMQAFNATTMVKGSIELDAPSTRIYSPGVVPKEAVANFSRAGLTTVTGSSAVSLRFGRGAAAASARMSLNGLADLGLSLEAILTPYERKKLELADRGVALGGHAIPDLSLAKARFSYLDRGLEENAIDMTGVPLGRYISELGSLMIAEQRRVVQPSLSAALEQVSSFFRYAGQGYDMSLTLSPDAPIELSKLLVLALTDAPRLAAATNATLLKHTPVAK